MTNVGVTTTGTSSYPRAKTITSATATVDTSQSQFGGASAKFVAASAQIIVVADNSAWAFGTADFTIDFWVRFNTLPANGVSMSLMRQRVDANNSQALSIFNNAGTYQFVYKSTDAGVTTINVSKNTSPNLATGTWYHFALVRNVNNWYMFQGGTQIGTTTVSSASVTDFAAELDIPTIAGTTTGLDGWIDEFRISNTARWTANFTPAVARYDYDVNTLILLHMDGTNGSTTYTDDVVTGQALVFNATLSDTNINVTSVSVYSLTAGNMRVAIYSNSSGNPGNKLWESGDTAVLATTWNVVNISAGTPTSLNLNSGTYWLGIQWNPGTGYTAGPSYTAGAANNGQYIFQVYGTFPSSWSGGTSTAEDY